MDLRLWPYVVTNDNGKPKILVELKGEKKRSFAPEEISSMVLFRMRQLAEAHLGTPVKDAVVTVPSYFNNAQRHATRAAGAIAGLNVLRIINEPTAAALAYGLDRNLKGEKNVLVYDLGGGTIDVSVLTIGEGSLYEVKSTAGNTRLGGDNFDNRLAAYFAEDFKKRYGLDIMKNAKAMRKLKCVSEKTKRFLTSANETTVEIDSLFNGIDYYGRISREFFEELCSDLFMDTLRPVQNALTDARMTKSDIDNVILVGASTRIPKVRQMLQEYFGKPPTTSINPDEAVAHGAAIQAAILSGEDHEKFQDVLLVDVVPLSLGVETARGMMFKVIDKNTTIPCRQTKDLTTLEDYQREMTIEVYEGERALTKDNHLLGAFELKNIPPAPRGVAKVDVTFDVDANGILNVSAADRSTGRVEGITIKNEIRLHSEDIEKMIADAETFREEDLENKHYLEARNQLETYVYNVKQIITESGDSHLSEDEKMTMLNECKEVIEWLDNTAVNLREEYESKLTELMSRWAKTMSKFYENRLKHRTKRQRSENLQDDIVDQLIQYL